MRVCGLRWKGEKGREMNLSVPFGFYSLWDWEEDGAFYPIDHPPD